MASADGAAESHPREHRPGSGELEEPSVLRGDFPWPARWEPILGPGGEEIAAERLTPIGSLPTDVGSPPSSRPSRVHRRRRPKATRQWTNQAPRAGTARRASRRTVRVAVFALVALVASVAVSEIPRPWSDPQRGASGLEAPDLAAAQGSDGAQWIAAWSRLEALMRGSQRRQEAEARQPDEGVRDTRRPRPQTVRADSAPQSPMTQAPARTTDPYAGVPPAEREFTPGPWSSS